MRFATLGVVFAFAGLVSVGVVRDDNSELMMRGAGVLVILAGLGTVVLPILHRLYGVKAEAASVELQQNTAGHG